MSITPLCVSWRQAVVAVVVMTTTTLLAQPASLLIVSNRPAVPFGPPMPPTWESPVNYFRKLLAADAAERERLLAGKTAEQRQIFLTGLREYEMLSPAERDARLAALDLRSYLTPLMAMAPSNRVARLRAVPESIRPMVEARLEAWDELPAESQKLLLQNEKVMRLLVAGSGGRDRELGLAALNSAQIRQMEADIARWRELPGATRARIYAQFRRIFDATERQRQETFAPLNEAELKLMQRALDNFRKLPAAQRARCLEGFQRFAELSPAERRQFLLNAEEWRRMSPEDRRLWRELVERMPPLPPGWGAPPTPPRWPLATLRPDARLSATNP